MTCQSGHGQNARTVSPGRTNARIMEKKGVDCAQCLRAVRAFPRADLMFERRRQTEPTALSGQKLQRSAVNLLWCRFEALGNGRMKPPNLGGIRKVIELLQCLCWRARIDSDGSRVVQTEALDARFLKPSDGEEREHRREGPVDWTTRDRMHKEGHVSPTTWTGLRLWATGIGKSFKADLLNVVSCTP